MDRAFSRCKKYIILLQAVCVLLILTACSYHKPERYSVQGFGVDSLTAALSVDVDMTDVKVSKSDENVVTTYVYSFPGGDGGEISKRYYDYIKADENCYHIRPYDEMDTTWVAYIAKKDKTDTPDGQSESFFGFTMVVTYTADECSVSIRDNLKPDEVSMADELIPTYLWG